jgi:Uma2 family endonuclease
MTLFQEIKAKAIPARLTVDEVYELTAAGVLREGENFELIDGEIVPMAAAKAHWHDAMATKLNRALVRALPDSLRLHVEPSITLASDTLVEPDFAAWPLGVYAQDVRGSDIALLIEVADSSLSYDLRVKAPLCARYGVRDYWVVDAVRQTVRVHRLPGAAGYADVDEFEAHQPVRADLAGVIIQLDQLD